MPKIYISPSDQTANKYAYGGTNEDKQCERIADACEVALKRCGFEVKNNKTASMYDRCRESDNWGADLHVPIHTNAANKKAAGTIIFCWDKSGEGYKASKAIYNVLAPLTPGKSAEGIRVEKDFYEIRFPNAPTAYVECTFHDVADEAKWIVEHTTEIGEAIAKGICNYFGKKYVEPVVEKTEEKAVEKANTDGTTVTLPTLKSGSKGNRVKAVQALLKGYGYGLGIWGVDGDFGAATVEAVKKFQKKNGLTADGIVGAKTWKALLGL